MDNKFLLLEYLISQTEFKSSAELADVINVSSKTISRYIKDLNGILDEYGFKISSRQGLGFGFNIQDSERTLLETLYQETLLPYYKVDENYLNIFKNLLDNKKYTYTELSRKIFQSESNLKKELSKLKIYLEKYNLDLISNNYGYLEIIGSYENKLECFLNYLHNLPSENNKKFLPLIHKADYEKTYEFLDQYIADNKLETSDVDLQFISDLILVCVNEIRASRFSIMNQNQNESESISSFKKLCKSLNIESFYNFEKIISEWVLRMTLSEEDEFYYILKEDIIDTLSRFDTSVTDKLIVNEELINQLVIHMSKFINRTSKGISIENPVINDIKKGFPLEFSLAYYLCKNIGEKYKAILNEDEIGFIAVYLATQKELIKSKDKNIAIICHYGLGTANLIRERVQNNFPKFNILGIFSYTRREDAYKLLPDLVISSVELLDCPFKNIYVKDLFSDDFVKIIRQKSVNELDQNCLVNLISNDNFYEINAINNDQAIRNIGKKLVNDKKIKEVIIDEVLEREKISSTDIGNLVAIPHIISAFQDKSIISICKLDKPIKWGTEFVQVIFFIVFNDMDKKNLRAFRSLYHFIENPINIDSLLMDFSYENFINLLNQE